MSAAAKMKYIPWKTVERETLNPLIDREMLVGDKLMLARVLMKKGAHVPLHQHHNRCAALSWRYIRASSSAFSSVNAPSATSSARAAATAVRAERAASQNVSSAPTASLNGNASEPNIMRSG